MRTIRRGVAVALLVVASVMGVTSAASAQAPPPQPQPPSSLDPQTQRDLADWLERHGDDLGGPTPETYFKTLYTAVFAVVIGVVAVMLVVVLFVLVSAQWRRARADAEVVRRGRSAGADLNG
jgi:hypothetical protein